MYFYYKNFQLKLEEDDSEEACHNYVALLNLPLNIFLNLFQTESCIELLKEQATKKAANKEISILKKWLCLRLIYLTAELQSLNLTPSQSDQE